MQHQNQPVGLVRALIFIPLLLAAASGVKADGASDAAGAEFFEQKIRPLLVESCLSCHSAASRPVQGGLRLDSRAAILRGGGRGAALVPGSPEKSLLIAAFQGREGMPQMPPKGRLPAGKIALLEEWIRRGAPWPAKGAADSVPAPKAAFNLKDRAAKHWAWKPIRVPTIPAVRNSAWVRNPVDAFVLARLEARGLSPAPPAERRALIRRVTFDLIGLPPTPAEVDAFLNDTSSNAYERVVDRLLASPHYGERWARHWLDLVRYAETYGHEGDFDKPGAYQYRDYVIRAMNADVPYDRFVTEHVAGDLAPTPRKHPAQGYNEAILGTGFWWLGEGTHSPVDLLQDESDRLDNQVDVFGKAFLGLSLGCARCHDHKFDAISTKDYYALSGFLRSSRYQLTAMDCPERMQPSLDALQTVAEKREALLRRTANGAAKPSSPVTPPNAVLFEDFSHENYAGWTATGQAFANGPRHGLVRTAAAGSGTQVVRESDSGAADSGFLSERLHGVLRSRSFTITKKKILYRVAGRGAEVRLILHGLQLITDPIYGGLRYPLNGDDNLRWIAQDVSKWIGYRAYIELSDTGLGHLIADRILFSDDGPPEEPKTRTVGLTAPALLSDADLSELNALDSRRAEIEAKLPNAPRALAMADGTGENDRVHIRGSYKTLGDEVPRRFLEALGGTAAPPPTEGSGRLDLARRLVEPARNPLVPRVLVNRLWLHHFGEGLVRTPDDFGAMGERPTHPDLLDWLAATFTAPTATGSQPWACNWSLKRLHRLMVLSSAYRMSTRIDPKAELADPTNRLLHRMPVRRLEAEAIRDSVLAVSSRLDLTQFGPSVLPYLSPYMEGRGKPGTSGSLDGDGRRSIYTNVRRNFLPLFFLAFDYPTPFTCIGRRSTSNVPAQALAMMNNPFILQQSEVWAKRILADPTKTTEQRIAEMYQSAFSRPPDPAETADAREFLAQQPRGPASTQSWTDLCHVLFNVKEFLFVN